MTERTKLWLPVILVTVLCVGCAPPTFVKSAPGWKTIELNQELMGNYDKSWQKAVDTIAREYDIEMLDKESGYLRTAWMYGVSGGIYNRYRGRLTLKFPTVVAPNQVDVKTSAQWLQDPGYMRWVSGFDKQFQRDVFTNLAGRLGRGVPAE
ncbi:MAG: hypothetical protein ACYTEL_21630 [Planctomycetota bacterium]